MGVGIARTRTGLPDVSSDLRQQWVCRTERYCRTIPPQWRESRKERRDQTSRKNFRIWSGIGDTFYPGDLGCVTMSTSDTQTTGCSVSRQRPTLVYWWDLFLQNTRICISNLSDTLGGTPVDLRNWLSSRRSALHVCVSLEREEQTNVMTNRVASTASDLGEGDQS